LLITYLDLLSDSVAMFAVFFGSAIIARRGDLTKARQAVGHSGADLRNAVDVRDLARQLAGFTDPVE
jgi:hypothetical protein